MTMSPWSGDAVTEELLGETPKRGDGALRGGAGVLSGVAPEDRPKGRHSSAETLFFLRHPLFQQKLKGGQVLGSRKEKRDLGGVKREEPLS